MRRLCVVLLSVLVTVLAGCSNDDAKPVPTTQETVTVTAEPSIKPSTSPTKSKVRVAAKELPLPFPEGYPKRVPISSLPDQVRSYYQMDDANKFAVAVAPGVWTELPPGASVLDAVTSGVLDGFCASVKAYEREYTPGFQHAGTCW